MLLRSVIEFDTDGHGLAEHVTWAEFLTALFNIQLSTGDTPASTPSPSPEHELPAAETQPPPMGGNSRAAFKRQQSALLDDDGVPMISEEDHMLHESAVITHAPSSVAYLSEHLMQKALPNSPAKARYVPTEDERRSSGRKVSYTKQADDEEKAQVLSQCISDPAVLVGWMVELPHFGTGAVISHKRERSGVKSHNLFTIKFDSGPPQVRRRLPCMPPPPPPISCALLQHTDLRLSPPQTLSLDRHNHKDGRVSVSKLTQQKTYEKVPFQLIQRVEKLPAHVQANPMRGASAQVDALQSSKIRC